MVKDQKMESGFQFRTSIRTRLRRSDGLLCVKLQEDNLKRREGLRDDHGISFR
jgi:hypothetical protein